MVYHGISLPTSAYGWLYTYIYIIIYIHTCAPMKYPHSYLIAHHSQCFLLQHLTRWASWCHPWCLCSRLYLYGNNGKVYSNPQNHKIEKQDPTEIVVIYYFHLFPILFLSMGSSLTSEWFRIRFGEIHMFRCCDPPAPVPTK